MAVGFTAMSVNTETVEEIRAEANKIAASQIKNKLSDNDMITYIWTVYKQGKKDK